MVDEQMRVEIVESDTNPGIDRLVEALKHAYDTRRPLAVVFCTSEGVQAVRLVGLRHAKPEIFEFEGYLREDDGSFGQRFVRGIYDPKQGTGSYAIVPPQS